jgi:hypothetical protein
MFDESECSEKDGKKNRNRNHVIVPSALLFEPSALLSLLHYSLFDILRFDIQKGISNIQYRMKWSPFSFGCGGCGG